MTRGETRALVAAQVKYSDLWEAQTVETGDQSPQSTKRAGKTSAK
ncbi:MAG: hypothetical protein ACU0CO_15050 [Shimia sp.]